MRKRARTEGLGSSGSSNAANKHQRRPFARTADISRSDQIPYRIIVGAWSARRLGMLQQLLTAEPEPKAKQNAENQLTFELELRIGIEPDLR